jgi:GT2 family glycosyltransferase
MNKVYIIIVNFNNFTDTIECLESVLKSNYPNYQIFIVDNSTDDSSKGQFSDWAKNNDYDGIKTNFSHLVFPLQDKPVSHKMVSEFKFSNTEGLFDEKIIFIRAKNNGFAAANNIVLSYILKKSPVDALIWLLNNDTVIEKNTLYKLVDSYFNNINTKYVFGSKLKFYYKPHALQAVAGHYNKWLGKHCHIGENEEDKGQHDHYKFGPMDYIVGASFFLPKLFLEQAGLMDEQYFLYFEEMDWIKNGALHGFTPALAPGAVVYHKEGASIINYNKTTRDTSVAEYYSITNRVRFIKKWEPLYLITVLPGIAWALVKRLLTGKFKLVRDISVSLFYILFFNRPAKANYNNN